MLAAVEADLKRDGFPPLAHYDALLDLRRAGEAGLRPSELQRAMLLAQYNLSRLVERLVRAGQVERRAAEGDARGHTLHVTETGRELLRRMWPRYERAIAERFRFAGRLTPDEVDALAVILAKLGSEES